MAYNLTRLIKELFTKRIFLCQSKPSLSQLSRGYDQQPHHLVTGILNKPFKVHHHVLNKSLGNHTFQSSSWKNLSSSNGLRYFHTTQTRHVPAIIWVILRPIGKLAAVLMGRSIRKWYRALPPNKKQLFKQWLMKNAEKIGAVFAVLAIIGFIFYETHIQETPVTKRKRFILFTEDQLASIADIEFQNSLDQYKDKLLPPHHPFCRRVEQVAMRILNANRDIKQIFNKKWAVTVVDDPGMKNAFVLPNGQIFVFTGILDMCQNDDQLGVILAHEMAHSICGHTAEIYSYTSWIDFALMIGIALIWALPFSSIFAGALHFVTSKITSLTLTLPFNRELESEADEVGLELAAKSCFDVREFVAFWRKMDLYETMELGPPKGNELVINTDFLSTHPAHDSRAENLENLLEEATKLRAACNCPRLPSTDPRAILDQEIRNYEAKMQAEKLKNVIILDVKPTK